MATMTSFLPVNNAAGSPAHPLPSDHHHHHPSATPFSSKSKVSASASASPSAPFPSPPAHAAVAAAAAAIPSTPPRQSTNMDPPPGTGTRDEQHWQQHQRHEQEQEHHEHGQSTADDDVKDEQPTARPASSSLANPAITATGTQRSADESSRRHPEDHSLHEPDEEHQLLQHDDDASDHGADLEDVEPPSKKKKGQRFYCTDFPPCNLSFTRSEHLARHIRKHTGERPFQCCCTRRFSRLDNLRQHAQTVHVNEDIPSDSLAAAVTRMHRQVRPDRVRPAGGRARASTGGGPQTGRVHRRNLSGSSHSVQLASFTKEKERQQRQQRQQQQQSMLARRPSRRAAKLTVDTTTSSPPGTPPGQVQGIPAYSPATASFYPPPSSAWYPPPFPNAEAAASPYFASPASSTSGFWSDRETPRRLSFPTGAKPFDAPYPAPYPPHPSYGPPPSYPQPHPQQAPPHPQLQPQPPYFTGPAGDQASQDPSSESDWRRRTWHASSSSTSALGRPPTSGSWFSQSVENQATGPAPAAPQQPTPVPPRLPGIESFDRVQSQPEAPPRRAPTPMQVDSATDHPAGPSAPSAAPSPSGSSRPGRPIPGRGHHRRGNVSIDTALQMNLTRLDIHGRGSQDVSQWGQPTTADRPATTAATAATTGAGQQPQGQQAPDPAQPPSSHEQTQGWGGGIPFQQAGQAPPASMNGPGPTVHGRSMSIEDRQPQQQQQQGPGPSYYTSQVERRHSFVPPEYLPRAPQQPTIHPPPPDPHAGPGSGLQPPPVPAPAPVHDSGGLGRLEALVAVATSESENQRRETPRSSS